MCFESDLNSKNSPQKAKKMAPKDPKKVQKRPKMLLNQKKEKKKKRKDRAVLHKPKLIVYIGRSQKKGFEPDPKSKNSSERVQKVPKWPQWWPN